MLSPCPAFWRRIHGNKRRSPLISLLIWVCLIHKSDSAIASKRAHGDEATLGVRWDARRVLAPSESARSAHRIRAAGGGLASFWSAVAPRIRGAARRDFSHNWGVVLLLPETVRAEEDTKSQLCEQRALRACVLSRDGMRLAGCCSETHSRVMRFRGSGS